jgi:hypothetical protein
MTSRTRRCNRALATIAGCLALVAILTSGGQALAQTPGRIAGTVTDGTEGVPVPGIEVRAHLFSVQGEIDTLRTTTDRKGRFAFDELPEGVAGYQLAVTYDGAEYRSVAATFTPGQTAEQTVTVWQTTKSPENVTLTDHIVWVDREGEGVAIQMDFAWSNTGDTAYIGDGEVVTRVPLPPGAGNLQFLGTFLEYRGDVRDGAYVSSAPIVPGTSSATIRYNAPPMSRLNLTVPLPTTTLQVFVPQDVRVTARALRLSGTVTDQGVTYNVYEAGGIAAGTRIDLAMSEAAGGTPTQTAMWIMAGVLAVGVLIGLALLAIRRKRPARGPAARPRASAGRTEAADGRPTLKSSRANATVANDGRGTVELEDPDLIIAEIAALDLSFERGLLEERTYRRLRVAAKDRLLRVEAARAKGERIGRKGR